MNDDQLDGMSFAEAAAGQHRADDAAPLEPAWLMFLRTYGKAIVAPVIVALAYLQGVEADGISRGEWLGLIPFVAAAAGFTWAAPSRRTG